MALIIPGMWVKQHYARERVVTLPDGRRARIHVDDSRTVQHTETDDTLDALVRPRTQVIRVQADPRWADSPLIRRLRQEGRR